MLSISFLLLAIAVFVIVLMKADSKRNLKNAGIITMLIGAVILLGSFMFSSGYDPRLGLFASISFMDVVIIEGKYVKDPPSQTTSSPPELINFGPEPGHYEGRVAFPIKYSLFLGGVLILMGLAAILTVRKEPLP